MIWLIVSCSGGVLALAGGATLVRVLMASQSITYHEVAALTERRRAEINRLEAIGVIDRLEGCALRNALSPIPREPIS